jgi:MFS family permease
MAHDNMNTKALALLGLGHMMVDLNTGALPALLPFLKISLDLSYTMIGTLVLVASLSSSLIQPLFGHLSDRSARPWLLPFGVFAATAGMAAIGLASSYQSILLLVCVSGIGIASYHPEAYKTAYLATGEKKATGISLFSVGGNIGSGLGPRFVTASAPRTPCQWVITLVFTLVVADHECAADGSSGDHWGDFFVCVHRGARYCLAWCLCAWRTGHLRPAVLQCARGESAGGRLFAVALADCRCDWHADRRAAV